MNPETCDHPKESRDTDYDGGMQTCRACKAFRFEIEEPIVAFVIGAWGAWRDPNTRTFLSGSPKP